MSVARNVVGLVGLLVFAWPVSAAAADGLAVSNDPCLIFVCAGDPSPPTSVPSGDPFNVYVAALLQSVGYDVGYRGTIIFTSTDPLASLPAAYTFVAADGGRKAFSAVILRTAGPQTITGTDPVNGLSGSLTLKVTGQPSVSVPTLSRTMEIVFALLLALTALWLPRLRL